jgi:diguanylate cyclase (GGDEF)-like protein
MSDNDADVILITRDRKLHELIANHRPPSVRLRCLAPADLEGIEPPLADQWWLDLDCETVPNVGACRRRVYFYSELPETSDQLPSGLFLRKPCEVPALTVLWAGVGSEIDEDCTPADRGQTQCAERVPGWLMELHKLDLHGFCHTCVQKLPVHLGYAEVALYLYDADQNVLTLAETNSKSCVDLAVPLAPDNDHVLAAVARSGEMLITSDLAETCRTSGMRCPPEIERESNRGAAVVPLLARGKLCGMLQLRRPRGAALGEADLPLDQVFAFLARCLDHARRHMRARIEARVDQLTGLYNYRWMVESVGREIQRAQRHGNDLGLIMIDLDGLKAVNDRFGHQAGDALLRHAAGKITAALRQIDSAARIGGDEFVVLLPATDLAGARNVARRIVTAIRTDAPLIGRRPLPVAASLGVAQWREGWDEKQLLKAADKAMYSAKRRGPNHLACHPHKTTAKPPDRSQIHQAK